MLAADWIHPTLEITQEEEEVEDEKPKEREQMAENEGSGEGNQSRWRRVKKFTFKVTALFKSTITRFALEEEYDDVRYDGARVKVIAKRFRHRLR